MNAIPFPAVVATGRGQAWPALTPPPPPVLSAGRRRAGAASGALLRALAVCHLVLLDSAAGCITDDECAVGEVRCTLAAAEKPAHRALCRRHPMPSSQDGDIAQAQSWTWSELCMHDRRMHGRRRLRSGWGQGPAHAYGHQPPLAANPAPPPPMDLTILHLHLPPPPGSSARIMPAVLLRSARKLRLRQSRSSASRPRRSLTWPCHSWSLMRPPPPASPPAPVMRGRLLAVPMHQTRARSPRTLEPP